MKKTRRIAAMVAAMALAATMAAPMCAGFTASAKDVSVTIKDNDNKADYNAYKLLDVTYAAGADATTPGKYSYTVNEDYRTVLQQVTGKTDDKDIIDYISKLNTADDIRGFADSVYAKVKNMEADKTLTGSTASNVAQGYYLIAQTAVNGKETSLVILDTADEDAVEIDTKSEVPQFTKEILDINDSTETEGTWGSDADHDMGDDVSFRLTATLPADYASYEYYTLNFHDDLEEDVFGTPENFVVKVYDTNNKVVKTLGETEFTVADGCGKSHSEKGDGCDFVLEINDLTSVASGAVANGKVVVEYTAELTTDANVGSAGNWNTGKLVYSNNPYATGEGDNTTSETPDVTVVAFTYKTVINKTDKGGNPLAGAGFTLYKKAVNGDYEEVEVIAAAENKTTFEFRGLDDGLYKLVESTTPDGYSTMEDVYFTVTANHVDKELKELEGGKTADVDGGDITLTVDKSEGSLSANVINESGSRLPSAGGMGTTLFVLGGGVTAALAGVYLVSKRRAKNAE